MKRLLVCTLTLAWIAALIVPIQAAKLAYFLTEEKGKTSNIVLVIHNLSSQSRQKISINNNLNPVRESLQWSSDGHKITFHVLDNNSRAMFNNRSVYSIDFASAKPLPKKVCVGSSPCYVKDPDTGKAKIMYFADGGQIFIDHNIYFKYLDDVEALDICPNNNEFVMAQSSSKGDTVKQWISAAKLSKPMVIPRRVAKLDDCQDQGLSVMSVCPDGRRLLIISGMPEMPYRASLIDLTTGKRSIVINKVGTLGAWKSSTEFFYSKYSEYSEDQSIKTELMCYNLLTRKSVKVATLPEIYGIAYYN